MKFNTVFRGYDKNQVDAFINQTEAKYDEVLRSQKERIFELVDENAAMKETVKQYQIDEQAISKSLIESQKLAEEMRYDAEKFAKIVLNRAKIFYAAWQSYAKTLLSGFSGEEIKQFNNLMKKIEKVMNEYEGNDVAATVAADVRRAEPQREQQWLLKSESKIESIIDDKKLKNPVEKIVNASGAVIDIRETLRPDKSLEEICKELGLIKGN